MSEQVYVDADMPQDLRDGPGMTLVALFGNSSRFDGVNPRCALTSDADIATGTFRIRHDCMVRGGQNIVQQMNALIGKGVVLTTGLEDGVGRCSISRSIPVDTSTGIATVSVDDPGCLAYGQDPARGVPAGNQVLLPRFVAYDTASPASFHTTMIEPPDIATAGVGLEMPDQYTVVGHGGLIVVSFVDALASNPQADVYLELQTEVAMSRLSLPTVPATVRTVGAGSAKLSLEGPLADIRNALQQLEYRSPSGYMGTDRLTGKIRSGSLVRSDNTTLMVAGNCGGQTCGTATRFDLGEFDPNTGDFTVRQYITSVSVCGNELPSTYYGYCGTKFKYDRADGLVTRYPVGQAGYHLTQCALAGDLTYGDPNNANNASFPYVLYSPKARSFQVPDHVTVFLYEQTSTPLNAVQEAQFKSLTENRFSLFFQFDTFDATGGTVNFQLNNIEKGRNLRARRDPFTVIDDAEDFNPGTIGSDGTLTTTADWKRPNDGIVIPLRLSSAAFNPATGLYELRHYNQDPDGDGVVDPNLRMQSWTGLNGWNIRATADDGRSVIYKKIKFNDGSAGRKADIQLKISGSQPCS